MKTYLYKGYIGSYIYDILNKEKCSTWKRTNTRDIWEVVCMIVGTNKNVRHENVLI